MRCQCWGPCQCTLFSLPASHSLGGGLKRGHRVQVKHTGILKEEKARENSDLFSNVGPLRREGTNADLRSCQMCCAAHLTQRGLCLSSVTPTDTFAQAEVEHIHTTNWSTLHPLWTPVCIIVLENVVSNLFPSYLLVK